MNLTLFKTDRATLCAGLLVDVVEDTEYTLKDIEKEFGPDVAHSIIGISKFEYSSALRINIFSTCIFPKDVIDY